MDECIKRSDAINSVFEAFADGKSAYDALNTIPAADVRPVVRGKWERVRLDNIGVCSNIVCSECLFEPWYNSTEPLYNFCPHCGTDMREKPAE